MKKLLPMITFLIAIILNLSLGVSPTYAAEELKDDAAAGKGFKRPINEASIEDFVGRSIEDPGLGQSWYPEMSRQGHYGDRGLTPDEVRNIHGEFGSSPFIQAHGIFVDGADLARMWDSQLMRFAIQCYSGPELGSAPKDDKHPFFRKVLESMRADLKALRALSAAVSQEIERKTVAKGDNFPLFTSVDRLLAVDVADVEDNERTKVPWILYQAILDLKSNPKLCFGNCPPGLPAGNLDYPKLSLIWWYAMANIDGLKGLFPDIAKHFRAVYQAPVHPTFPETLRAMLLGLKLYVNDVFNAPGAFYTYGGNQTSVKNYGALAKHPVVVRRHREGRRNLNDIPCHMGDCSSLISIMLAHIEYTGGETKAQETGSKARVTTFVEHFWTQNRLSTIYIRHAFIEKFKIQTKLNATEEEMVRRLQDTFTFVEPKDTEPGMLALFPTHIGVVGGLGPKGYLQLGDLNRYDDFRLMSFRLGHGWTYRDAEPLLGGLKLKGKAAKA